MSNFLMNLARRGAGLPVATVQAPPLSPFGQPTREQANELAEADVPASSHYVAEEKISTGNASDKASTALPLDRVPGNPTPSIQRFNVAEPGVPIEPSGPEPAPTPEARSSTPTPVPGQHALPNRREAEGTPMVEPENLSNVAPSRVEREVITETKIEHDRQPASPAEGTIGGVGNPPRHANTPAADAPDRVPNDAPAGAWQKLLPGRPPEPAPKAQELTLSVPTIRPVLSEARRLVQFPKPKSAISAPPSAQLPIHVRIGRVEVRAPAAPATPPATPGPPAPIGFDSYYRMRNYRG